jgi:hypothetical protein
MIGNAQIDDSHINTLSATKITSGYLNSQVIQVGGLDGGVAGGGYILIESRNGFRKLDYVDSAGVPRVRIGRRNNFPERFYDGLYVWDQNGKEILTANGLGVFVAGAEQLLPNSVSTAHFSGNSELNFVSAPQSAGVGNVSFWTVNIMKNYLFQARLVINAPGGQIIIPLLSANANELSAFEVKNEPIYLVPSASYSAWVEEISPSDFGGIPRGTWFRATSYPFPRTNPYKITVMEFKR